MLYYKNLALESTNFSGQDEMSQNSWFYLIENQFCPQKFILWQEQNQNKPNGHTPIETPCFWVFSMKVLYLEAVTQIHQIYMKKVKSEY